MKILGLGLLKIAGLAVALLGVLALGVVTAPVLLGQSLALRERPLVQSSTSVLGGSEIGVSLRDVSQADVTREKLAGPSGAVIDEVRSDSPAAKAGFKAGDVVVSFDGERVRSARHLTRLIQDTPDGREVEATVVRNGGQKVSLKVAPETTDLTTIFNRAFAPLRDMRWPDSIVRTPRGSLGTRGLLGMRGSARLGASVETLTDQLGDYFGTRDGVLVTSVDAGSPAKAAGLKAGDVITKINGHAISDTSDVRRWLLDASGDVTITVMRDRKELTLTAKL